MMTPDGEDGGNETPRPVSAITRLAQEAQAMRSSCPPASNSPQGNRDVTANFIAATQQLPPGELVKDEDFTLFEAVGALEIMDPKMDSGYIPPGDTFEPDFDVCAALPVEQVLGIMDELLRLELLFHDGYPLSQTIFTSLHVFRLISPENDYPYLFGDGVVPPRKSSRVPEEAVVLDALRAYCLGVIVCCGCILKLIQSQTYYEEEDFVTYQFGRDLCPKMSAQDAAKVLVEAMDLLDNSEIEPPLKMSLKQRLVMREHALFCMDESVCQSNDWDRLKRSITALKKDHDRTKPAPEAFSITVQRQLATSTPPRHMPELCWEDAHRKWLQMCDDMLAVERLTSEPARNSPHSLQKATWAFAYRDPAPNTYVRAKMQSVLTCDDRVAGEIGHFELLLADIRELVLAGDPLADPASFQIELPTDVRHRASRIIEDAMMKVFSEYLDVYRMVCQNRCRMRRTFTQAIPLLDELEDLMIECDERLNNVIRPRLTGCHEQPVLLPLTMWVRYHKRRIVRWTIQLGFETNLYLDYELAAMYFMLNYVESQTLRDLYLMTQATITRAGSLQRESDARYLEEARTAVVWLQYLRSESALFCSVSSALEALLDWLVSADLVDGGGRTYADEKRWYEARFKPFLNMTYDVIPSEEELKVAWIGSASATIMDLARTVEGHVEDARSKLAGLKASTARDFKCQGTEEQTKNEFQSIEKVCIAIKVAAGRLVRIYQKHGKQHGRKGDFRARDVAEVRFAPAGERYHVWWVVPQIVEK